MKKEMLEKFGFGARVCVDCRTRMTDSGQNNTCTISGYRLILNERIKLNFTFASFKNYDICENFDTKACPNIFVSKNYMNEYPNIYFF